jgi:uncharacterized tellurite resistance protein B-like protein
VSPGRDGDIQDDDDRTIRIVRRTARLTPRVVILILALAAVLATGGFALWIVAHSAMPDGSAILAAPRAPSGLDAPLADEATILAAQATSLQVFRFRDAPAVLVLSFPSLGQQGDMLDRVAAFVEKAGLPRDRVLADADLDAAIRQAGDTRETYYLGHDYRVADIARFFVTAERDGVVLDAEEVRLRALLKQAGMLAPGAVGALISIPPEVASQQIDGSARATILHHELSHGQFFTDPAYAAYVRNFWQTTLNDAQRAGFRRFLGGEGYDTADEDLILNETQAFLVHTNDSRYFLPGRAGLTGAEAARLREAFVRGMPDGWLKSATRAAMPFPG